MTIREQYPARISACPIEGCGRVQTIRGFCFRHYRKSLRRGEIQVLSDAPNSQCIACGHRWFARVANPPQCPSCGTKCWSHPSRQHEQLPFMEQASRFLSRVERDNQTGCWIWVGSQSTTGYGRFYSKGYAHRWVYEATRGVIPTGFEIDHLCRTRLCVNPTHLEAVTHQVNVLRGDAESARLHLLGKCKRGHLMTPTNTRHRKDAPNKRICISCEQLRGRERRTNPKTREKVLTQGRESSRKRWHNPAIREQLLRRNRVNSRIYRQTHIDKRSPRYVVPTPSTGI